MNKEEQMLKESRKLIGSYKSYFPEALDLNGGEEPGPEFKKTGDYKKLCRKLERTGAEMAGVWKLIIDKPELDPESIPSLSAILNDLEYKLGKIRDEVARL